MTCIAAAPLLGQLLVIFHLMGTPVTYGQDTVTVHGRAGDYTYALIESEWCLVKQTKGKTHDA